MRGWLLEKDINVFVGLGEVGVLDGVGGLTIGWGGGNCIKCLKRYEKKWAEKKKIKKGGYVALRMDALKRAGMRPPYILCTWYINWNYCFYSLK